MFCLLIDFVNLDLCRYVAQGKAILQPHQILDELENIIGDETSRKKLTDGPFGDALRTAQVITLLI